MISTDFSSRPVDNPGPAFTTLHFEPNKLGGSFFREDDQLLATLTLRRRPNYQGRLMIDVGQPAYDLRRTIKAAHWIYSIQHAGRSLGEATSTSERGARTITYAGQVFSADASGLYDEQGQCQAASQPAGGGRPARLIQLNRPLDLPLLALYIFAVFDPDAQHS
jgi:hypothetical protein